uniref:WGS project CBMG000000000 data, contig CS5907-c001977 n=1 Tax=Fusarium acuminatum CS5907 TaxID=1318461 RepID=A0A090MFK8_9HYPO|nr:unnamed protein product [Fusarium acuminatum CS5907]
MDARNIYLHAVDTWTVDVEWIASLGNGIPGSYAINDPECNAIAYWQAQTISSACGGQNPLPCYPSKAPGGRTYRLMTAKLGEASGYANVSLVQNAQSSSVDQVVLVYHNYSRGGLRFKNGWENVTKQSIIPILNRMHRYSNMVQNGKDGYVATKKSSPGGWHAQLDILRNIIESSGTLTTTVNGGKIHIASERNIEGACVELKG